jgi:hypothetical protein
VGWAGMIWNEDDILGFISHALEHQSSVFDAEQAVRGIDSLTEKRRGQDGRM